MENIVTLVTLFVEEYHKQKRFFSERNAWRLIFYEEIH